MLGEKIKRSFEEHKEIYIGVAVGTLLATGVFLGAKIQRKIDIKTLAKSLEDAAIFTKSVEPMFPDTMSILEIKEALTKIEGAEFFDALVVTVNGIQSLIIR